MREADIPFVAWPERVRERVPACLFMGSGALTDAIAARTILATAARLPDVVFELVGPVCESLGPVPGNVRLHRHASLDLSRRVRLGLSPVVETRRGTDRSVSLARAGLPVIASPEATRGLEPVLAECWLVCSPDPARLRDAIVESLEWDWSAPVAEARRIACRMAAA